MIWLIVLLVGGGLIGGLMAFLASDSKTSSKDNDVDIITTNGQGTQTEQGISRVPDRSLYLNTKPATVPMMPQPPMAPMAQQQPNVPFDIPDEKKDIKNTQELNSLKSLLQNQEKIKQLEEENAKLEKESKELEDKFNNKKENGVSEFLEELKKLTNSNELDDDVKAIFEAILNIKNANILETEKQDILWTIESLGNNTLVGNANNDGLAESITDLNGGVDESKTKKDILRESLKTILYSNDPGELVKAVDDIIIQFSRNKANTGDEQNLIVNGIDTDDSTLKGVFLQNKGVDDINNTTGHCLTNLCDKLKAVQDKIYQRGVDDNGKNSHDLSIRSIKSKHIAQDNSADTNNTKFADTLQKVCEQNKKIKQTKEFMKNNMDKNIKVLNDKLVVQFNLLNAQTDQAGQTNIKNDIKTTIVDTLNSVSSDKKTTNPDTSDRKKMWDYLLSIGIELANMPVGAAGTTTAGATDIGTITNANIAYVDKCFLSDKDRCDKLAKLIVNNKKIKDNEKNIDQLNKNISLSL